MRFVDIMLSIPSLLLAVSIAARARPDQPDTVMIAIGVGPGADLRPAAARLDARPARAATTCWPPTRSACAAAPIVLRHMLPNSLGPVIVQATLMLATAIIEAAALSFLGLGDPDPAVAEWGRMLGRRRRTTSTSRPQLAILPGARASSIAALGFTLLGEALREALDPKTGGDDDDRDVARCRHGEPLLDRARPARSRSPAAASEPFTPSTGSRFDGRAPARPSAWSASPAAASR